MNMLILLLFTTLSLDYRLLKSLLVGALLSFLGDVKMVLIFWWILAHYGGLLGVSFGSIFRFMLVLFFWGVKKSRGQRQEPPGAARSRRKPPGASLPGP